MPYMYQNYRCETVKSCCKVKLDANQVQWDYLGDIAINVSFYFDKYGNNEIKFEISEVHTSTTYNLKFFNYFCKIEEIQFLWKSSLRHWRCSSRLRVRLRRAAIQLTTS